MQIFRKRIKVGDMTVKKLKELIRGVALEFIDRDCGLELRPEVEVELRDSLKRKEKGIPLETVAKQLGLE